MMKSKFGKILIATLAVCLLFALIGTSTPTAQAQTSQPYNFKSVHTGAGGGFIVDVVFHPKAQNVIYAKTDMGGIYRWNATNSTWTQLMNWVPTDKWNWTGGESIAVDPSDPNKLYMAGGTYTNGWAPDNGVILRSNDRGNTWAVTQMPFKMGGNMPGRGMGERLAVDPNNGNILYFGARDLKGLWKSTNAGVSWTQVTNFPATGVYAEDPNDTQFDYNNHPVGIPWVVFDPASGTPGSGSSRIYVGVADGRSGQSNIYWSNNAGSTWQAVPGQPTCTLSGNIVTCPGGLTWDKTALGDDGQPSSPKDGLLAKQGALDSQGTLYVTYSNWAGPYRGSHGDVWKFAPGTSTWTRINPTTGNNACGFTNAYWGYGGLGVDMQNPGTLVVAAVNSWWPDGQLFRSTDGGATWRCIWDLTGWPVIAKKFSLSFPTAPWLNLGNPTFDPPEPSVKLGWMMEGLKIDPFNSNRMMYGTGATLYGTTNLSAWDTGGIVNISSMAVGMEETSVLGLVSPPTGSTRLFSVVGDIGGWKHTSLDAAPSANFTIPISGTNTSIDYAELSPSFLVRVGYGKSNNGTRQPYRGTAFTFDSGGSWFQGNNDIVPDKGGGTVAAAANASRVMWAPDGAPVAVSTDNGNSWTQSQGGVPQNSYVASDRVNPSKFYAFGGGKFYSSTNGGVNFTASAATGFPTAGKIKAVAGREGHVWLAGGEMISGGSTVCNPCGLWRTTDSGATFTKVATVDFAAAIGFGMARPGGSGYPTIFISGRVNGNTLTTIYRSDDEGATWVRITDDQHMYATIQTITGDPTIYGRVYFGTNGLGIIYGDPSGTPPATNTPGGPTRTNTPVTPTRTTVPPTNTSVVPTNTPVPPTVTRTRTNTPQGPTATRTRTNTPGGPTATRTRTATRTATRTITVTSAPPTVTRAPNTPTVPPTVPPTATSGGTSTLKVQYRAADTNAGDNQMKPHFNIVNTGSASVNMSELKIRYYFTKDAGGSMVFNCDWAVKGCGNLSGAFVAATGTNTDTYLEVSFTTGAGSIAAGQSSGEMQIRLNKSDWTNFNESNDYSFDPTKTAFADWTRVVLLRNGTVVWGTQP